MHQSFLTVFFVSKKKVYTCSARIQFFCFGIFFKNYNTFLNKEEIVTLIGFVGDKLASNETKSIESSFAGDLSNASSIEYEIVE